MTLPLNRKLFSIANSGSELGTHFNQHRKTLVSANKTIYQLNNPHNYVQQRYILETDYESMIIQEYPFRVLNTKSWGYEGNTYQQNITYPNNNISGLLAVYIVNFDNFPIENISLISSDIIIKSPIDDSSGFFLGGADTEDVTDNTYKQQRYFEYKSDSSFRYHHTLAFWLPYDGIEDIDNETLISLPAGSDVYGGPAVTYRKYIYSYIAPTLPYFQSKFVLTIHNPTNV